MPEEIIVALAIYIDFIEGHNIVYDPRQQIISILMKSQENSAHLKLCSLIRLRLYVSWKNMILLRLIHECKISS